MPYCPKCGNPVEDNVAYCPNCGAAIGQEPQPVQPAQPVPPYVPPPAQPMPIVGTKSEILAAILSFLLSGLGQIYVGQISRGIGFLVIGVVLYIVGWYIGIIFIQFIFALYTVWDAYNLAKKYNSELARTGRPPW